MVQLNFDATAPIGGGQPEPQPAPQPGPVIPMMRILVGFPDYPIWQSSPAALERAEEMRSIWVEPATDPPYWELKVGESIAHRMDEFNVGTLRVKMGALGKRMGRRFAVLVHRDKLSIEVARIL